MGDDVIRSLQTGCGAATGASGTALWGKLIGSHRTGLLVDDTGSVSGFGKSDSTERSTEPHRRSTRNPSETHPHEEASSRCPLREDGRQRSSPPSGQRIAMTRAPATLRPVSEAPAWTAEYPFTPHYLDLGGHRYHYVDEGSGPVILFVHGNPTWSFAWRRFLTDLARNHRVIAVDHIGCGKSDKPQNDKYVLANHVANLSRLIDELGLRDITLVGHDWGGCIGMGAAVRRPERFGRFILMNTAAFRSRRIPLRIAVCRIPVLGALAVRGFNAFAGAALWMAVEHQKEFGAATRAGFVAPYDSWANRIATHEFVRDIPLAPSHRSYQTLVEIETGLAQFQDRPVLFLWGEKDWCFTLEFLREWQQRFPSAQTITYADAGHYVFEDAHERMLTDIRNFLSQTQTRTPG